MIAQFVEVTDLLNNTFMVNVNDILFVRQVTGRTNQVEITIKTPEGVMMILIQANYRTFLTNYRVSG